MKTKCLSSLLVVLLGLQTFNDEISILNVKADEAKSYALADFTIANENWNLLTVDSKGFKQESGQLVFDNSEYDATANGAWLTFKVQADNGNKIDELKLACIGNRLGSFGKAVGASNNTVSFKPYLSTTVDFSDTPLEEKILPVSDQCYNLDYDFTSYLTDNASTYYVKLWFGSSTLGEGFYYDWFQLGTVNITGQESKVTYSQTYVDADYTIANENWGLTTIDNKGFFQENNQLTLISNTEYDATANGAWLTYKIETKKGSSIDELKLACIGNRLGSFGKAAGATSTTVSFKPYLSTTTEFSDTPLEEKILLESTECYNLDYDFTPYLTANESTYYVKLWFGSSVAGSGFYYDWFQLGKVSITGKESGSKEEGPKVIDASNATITIESNEYTETGDEIKPVPVVTLNDKTLVEKQDYFVTYEHNIEPGKGKVNVTFINDYTGNASIEFTIKALPISYDDASYKINKYVPDKYDFIDYWGGAGDIEPEYGDGVTSFAHISSLVPLKGQNIKFTTSVQLLSKNADNVDGWVTYSFSSQSGEEGNDKSFPYYGGNASGYFLHMTNYSNTENPSNLEVQFVKSINGETTLIDKFFVSNLITNTGVLKNDEIIFNFSLVKNENGSWTLCFTNKATNEIIFSKAYDYLNERLFINQNGQTYLSSAIYEGNGCNGEHWNHRGLKIYDMDVFTLDATNTNVTLSQTEYIYEEGKIYKPEVSVTINDEKLAKDVDYYLEYQNNKVVGKANVIVNFIGQYAGNEAKIVEFDIINKQEPDVPSVEPSGEPSNEPSNEPSSTPSSSEQPTSSNNDEKTNNNKKGCKGEATATGFILLTLIGALFTKKRKNQ